MSVNDDAGLVELVKPNERELIFRLKSIGQLKFIYFIIPVFQQIDFTLCVGADRTLDVDGISDNQLDTRLCTDGLLLRGGSSGGGYKGKFSSISLWKLQSIKILYKHTIYVQIICN